MEIIFLPNGNTAVFENQEQVPRLQKSWLLFFYEFLKTEIEFNINDVEITLPNGTRARWFEITDDNGPERISWRII